MSKKDNYIAQPSKLSRFRSFEEMKSAPFAFPSSKASAQRLAEHEEAFARLRTTYSTNHARPLKKANKKTLK